MDELRQKAERILESVNGAILGKDEAVREIFAALLANGHVLMEDIPGVGKTTLASAFSRSMALDCRRVQFTPDVMPSDLTGFSIYKRGSEEFQYMPGSVFCNLLLADEINRTSPKTQSALLEVMEERRVTVEGVTRSVPSPFIVIATQNPYGAAGTQQLPESQSDRFMVTVSLGYPDTASEIRMAAESSLGDRTSQLEPVASAEDFLDMQSRVNNVYAGDAICEYIVNLITATRSDERLDRAAGPRATLSLTRIARASAWLDGRDYVIPRDVEENFPYVVYHRISLTPAANMNHVTKSDVIEEILSRTDAPSMKGKR